MFESPLQLSRISKDIIGTKFRLVRIGLPVLTEIGVVLADISTESVLPFVHKKTPQPSFVRLELHDRVGGEDV